MSLVTPQVDIFRFPSNIGLRSGILETKHTLALVSCLNIQMPWLSSQSIFVLCDLGFPRSGLDAADCDWGCDTFPGKFLQHPCPDLDADRASFSLCQYGTGPDLLTPIHLDRNSGRPLHLRGLMWALDIEEHMFHNCKWFSSDKMSLGVPCKSVTAS